MRAVNVRWPSGTIDRLTELEAGHLYVVVEGRGSVSVAPRDGSKLDGSGPIDRSR